MSGVAREVIHAALFERLQAVPGLKTTARRLRHWDEVGVAEQPALFQVQRGETIVRRPGLPPRRQILVDLYLYVHTGGDIRMPASTMLNPLVDAVEAALEPDPGCDTQTLGGRVVHAWIAGRIESDEGVLGDQAVAIIPVAILVPC